MEWFPTPITRDYIVSTFLKFLFYLTTCGGVSVHKSKSQKATLEGKPVERTLASPFHMALLAE